MKKRVPFPNDFQKFSVVVERRFLRSPPCIRCHELVQVFLFELGFQRSSPKCWPCLDAMNRPVLQASAFLRRSKTTSRIQQATQKIVVSLVLKICIDISTTRILLLFRNRFREKPGNYSHYREQASSTKLREKAKIRTEV